MPATPTRLARGYAAEDEAFEDGVRAVAAPVFVGGEAVAAHGVSGPGVEVETLAGHVVVLAGELTAAIAKDGHSRQGR